MDNSAPRMRETTNPALGVPTRSTATFLLGLGCPIPPRAAQFHPNVGGGEHLSRLALFECLRLDGTYSLHNTQTIVSTH